MLPERPPPARPRWVTVNHTLVAVYDGTFLLGQSRRIHTVVATLV